MRSTEPITIKNGVEKPIQSSSFVPYPVEGASMIVEPPPPDPFTADLISAVQYGYYNRVMELIEPNPSLAFSITGCNITLLHWAAINNHVTIADYLLSKGVPIDALGGELHSTPLHWAIRGGKLQMVCFLLSRHAQTSIYDREGFASLHLASVFGHTDIVAYLVAMGLNIDSLDQNGMSPLMHAVKDVRRREPTQLLIRLGAQVNLQNPLNKYTPLHYGILGDNGEAIHILLESGADPHLRNSENDSPYDIVTKLKKYRHLYGLFSPHQPTTKHLPTWLQPNNTYRRLGTKFLPYLIIITIAILCQIRLALMYKLLLAVALLLILKGYSMIFFDRNLDRYLPISIAQASIFWLYASYLYYFLEYVGTISFSFWALVICTYFSWKNFYLAQKRDPGMILNNREQTFQNIIQLIEQNRFNSEYFCTSCLIRRPIRSKHCRECRRCISKFDHHCPWIDNCVGEKNLHYFTGFLFFTPICLFLYLHGACLYYRDHCDLFTSRNIHDVLLKLIECSPAVLWFTTIAVLHIIWITGLCITILIQIATGYTTNEKINAWRYRHLQSERSSPFSMGCIQNLVDLVQRRFCCYSPIHIDWRHIYSLDEFRRSIESYSRKQMRKLSMSLSHV